VFLHTSRVPFGEDLGAVSHQLIREVYFLFGLAEDMDAVYNGRRCEANRPKCNR